MKLNVALFSGSGYESSQCATKENDEFKAKLIGVKTLLMIIYIQLKELIMLICRNCSSIR